MRRTCAQDHFVATMCVGHSKRVLGCLVALGLLSCGQPLEPGSSETSGSGGGSIGDGASSESETPTTSTGATTGQPTSASSEGGSGSTETTGRPLDCTTRNLDFDCAPMDCEHPIYDLQCGSIIVDDDGCFRPWCHADEDCPMGLTCYRFSECDPEASGCEGFSGCGMIDDECTCTALGGCQDESPPIEQQRGYCIPSELKPC